MSVWHVNYDVSFADGTVLKKSGKVSDPAKHFGEFLHRFFPMATKIEWTPMSVGWKQPTGPTRTVEFNEDGSVASRTPDVDAAHIGGVDWKPDPEKPEHTEPGTSRAGVIPRESREPGQHPSHADSDENLTAEAIAEKLARVLPPELQQQPPLTPVLPPTA